MTGGWRRLPESRPAAGSVAFVYGKELAATDVANQLTDSRTRAVDVDGRLSRPRTAAVGDGSADGADPTAGPTTAGAEACGGAEDGAGGAEDGAAGAVEMGAVAPAGRETGPGPELPDRETTTPPITSVAITAPTSSGSAPKRRGVGSTSRQFGQKPETGVVMWPQLLHRTGRRAIPRSLHSACAARFAAGSPLCRRSGLLRRRIEELDHDGRQRRSAACRVVRLPRKDRQL
jgi:hypothetical protein